MTSSLEFEGTEVPLREGDTVASALFRAGVRTFSRSFKYHRPRGLYCGTGDCPNCLMTVDGESCVRTCVTPARAGMEVSRGRGWPSADRDLLAGLWHLRRFLPVGFYYKSMLRPRAAWPLAEPTISRLAGIGPIDLDLPPTPRERRNHTPDLFVAGGGPAGLAAALAAAERGEEVVLADENVIGTSLPRGPARAAVETLLEDLRGREGVTVLEEARATGLYDGPLVAVADRRFLHLVHPGRIVVATGATERHAVFPGSDLPGVWLGRGAARLAGCHDARPAERVVLEARTEEGLEHLRVLREAGVEVVAFAAPAALARRAPERVPSIVDGRVVEAGGGGKVKRAVVESPSGRDTFRCDGVVLSLGLSPRDGLLRQAVSEAAVAAGEAAEPGCSVEEAVASGREAAAAGRAGGAGGGTTAGPLTDRGRGGDDGGGAAALPGAPSEGFVCLCEDVTAKDLADAWKDGFRSTELLKRYTTATMGPCQGAMCQAHLRGFVSARDPGTEWSAKTTARPPTRPLLLEEAAAGVETALEHHTALHERHLRMGAVMEWAGPWRRPERYGDPADEYWAVRRRVSIMDLGTLGKYRVAGPDATEFLERLYPCRVGGVEPGKFRYAVMLNEAGYVFDDGLICSEGEDGYYVTVTSGGASEAEAWMKDWAEAWGLRVHIVNLTAAYGAIIVAGPRARELLSGLTKEPLDADSPPATGHRRIVVAGVPCLALRSGFVGELGYELHHPASRSVELWDALLEAGGAFDLLPHGLETLRLLRLEKGHIIVGQDTDFDSTPAKLRMSWIVGKDKPFFVGKTALERLSEIPPLRKLVPIEFPGPEEAVPHEGGQLLHDDDYTGELTSCRYSPVLEKGVALGWITRRNGSFPERVRAVGRSGRETTGTVVTKAFYDPEGERLRA